MICRLFFIFLSFFSGAFLFAGEPVNILTFNIRLSLANDGENSWRHRKDFVIETIQNKSANGAAYDFIGMQEAVIDPRENFNQVNYIVAKMPKYDSIWLSREKTPDRGEAMLLLWRRDRWRIDDVDKGTFWLSDTPNVAGSKTDSKAGCPRCVTFGLFHELNNGKTTGKKIYVADTHYDHLSESARQRAAKQVINWIANRKEQNVPLVFMGDLNCGERSPAIKFMQGEPMILDDVEVKPSLGLVDTFRATNPEAVDVGTYNAFMEKTSKEKIDYIFVTKNLKTISSKIIRTKRNGRWPSDHCPVEAIVKWE
ncbi:MAG: endonuclease/exonuclease/phosphatase family protein [Planctomycetaceae bacterium]|jgi:endonuclease/exonuclease/phosphatase family metal-dependent hydrolase|nr:endonuclease/exonuclease/phosphatase family protein [Planctomycetaceae bacterium]